MAKSAKGEIVDKFLTANPEMPSLTAAKILCRDNPMDFKDVENARTMIRQYRGKAGEAARRFSVAGGKHYKPTDDINFAPYSMPKPEDEDIQPYKLPKAHNNIGILGDLHIPNHREKPINLAYQHFLDNGANTLILNGDILDNTPFTRHDGKRPSASDVRRWFDQAELFLEWTRDIFPNAAIYWTEGNHDFWYRRWMQAHAWQLDDDPYFSLQERLHIDEYKVKFIPQEQYVLAGKLGICHGHQLMGKWGSGVSPARTVFLKAKKSMVINHVHVTNDYTDTNIAQEITTCWSIACMCTLTPKYQPMGGKANHGFGHAVVENNGNYKFKNYRIHNGKIL